jgi:WD40 repeat protein
MKRLQEHDASNSLPRVNSNDRLSLFSYTYAQTANDDFRPHSTSPKNQIIKTFCKGILNAISPSPNKEMVAIAGRDILKVYSTGPNPTEIVNLKGASKTNLNCSSNDVKWGNSGIIISASSSGAIMLFDLNKTSNDKLDRTITEHLRSVHRICFHPSEHSLLISASQDGTIKIWDLRTKSKAQKTFDGKSESVRDVQFNPKSNYEFASVFDNGSLQTWDIRNPEKYERKWY